MKVANLLFYKVKNLHKILTGPELRRGKCQHFGYIDG